MTIEKNPGASVPSVSQYILDNFEPTDRIFGQNSSTGGGKDGGRNSREEVPFEH